VGCFHCQGEGIMREDVKVGCQRALLPDIPLQLEGAGGDAVYKDRGDTSPIDCAHPRYPA
jgi:hypothetical protein